MFRCAPFKIIRQMHNWVVKCCHLKLIGPLKKVWETLIQTNQFWCFVCSEGKHDENHLCKLKKYLRGNNPPILPYQFVTSLNLGPRLKETPGRSAADHSGSNREDTLLMIGLYLKQTKSVIYDLPLQHEQTSQSGSIRTQLYYI